MNGTLLAFAALALALVAPAVAWVLAPVAGSRKAPARVAAAAIPLAAVFLYLGLGNPKAIEAAAQSPPHRQDARDLQVMAARLEARLQAAPEDLEGWFMLARSRQVLEQWDAAAAAYRRAVALAPQDADLLADLADVLALMAGGDLEGEPRSLLEKALAAEPVHAKSHLLLAAADFRQGRVGQAAARWEMLLKASPADSEAARIAGEGLARARTAASPRTTASAAGR